MSSFFASATQFCILTLLVLAILDCTCRAASHFRFDEATGFIFVVREGLSSGDPHIYRIPSVSATIDFRTDFWQLYDLFAQAVDGGAVSTKSEAQKQRVRLSPEDQALLTSGTRHADPSIESLADSIESAWNSGEFKRAAALFRSANKISSSEFRTSYRLVALLTEYLSSAKLYREALLAADILVAIYPNLFQSHLARTRALTMLRLWDAAAMELSVVRRLQPSLQLLSTYQQDISTSAAKDAAAQGPRPNHSDGAESSRSAHTDSDEARTLDSWGNILRGLTHREVVPYVIFDTVACSCFIAIYTYMCRSKAAMAKAAKAAAVPVPVPAALPVLLQPAVALRRSRP